MMKRLGALVSLSLLLPALCAAVTLPEGGLPSGRLAASPMLVAAPVPAPAFAAFQARLRELGVPASSPWLALDAQAGTAAAGPLLARLPERFTLAAFHLAQGPAALEAETAARAAVARFEAHAAAGRAGALDLADLTEALKPFAVYGPGAARLFAEAKDALDAQRQARVSSSLERHRAALGTGAKVTSAGLLAASFAASLHPATAHASGSLAWAGLSAAAVSRFTGPVTAVASRAPQTKESALPSWLRKQLQTFLALGKTAGDAAEKQASFEAAVGDRSFPAFKRWLIGGLKAGALWAPLALLGMLGGSVLAAPLKAFIHAAPEQALPAAAIVHAGLWHMVNGYVAQQLVAQALTLGGAFAGLRALAARARSARPELAAGVLTLAAMVPFLLMSGFTWPLVFPVLGIQAVLILLYVRSRSLLAALTAQGLLAMTAVESTRMLAFLKVSVAGTLVGLPSWAGAAVGGLLAAAFAAWALRTQAGSFPSRLRAGVSEQLARVKNASSAGLLRLGLLWALPAYLSMEAAFRLTHAVLPQAEPTPEILRRLLLMPADVILFNFVIVAALEEWVFRRGVYRKLQDLLYKKLTSSRVRFWTAAVLSALIFSAAHYIDWNALLPGGQSGDIIKSLGQGAYAFTWASFAARAVGGLLLAFLYERSGLILLPMIAHFGSNTFEAIGQRFGLGGMLAAAAGILALQLGPWLKRRIKNR